MSYFSIKSIALYDDMIYIQQKIEKFMQKDVKRYDTALSNFLRAKQNIEQISDENMSTDEKVSLLKSADERIQKCYDVYADVFCYHQKEYAHIKQNALFQARANLIELSNSRNLVKDLSDDIQGKAECLRMIDIAEHELHSLF